jgi:hypothetical protein
MEMGHCAHCEKRWHSAYKNELVLPVLVPIDTDGASIMTVCQHCASVIPTELIATYARLCYVESTRLLPGASTHQSAEAESSISAWQKRTEALISGAH